MEISTVATGINTLLIISLLGWLVWKVLTDLNRPRGATRVLKHVPKSDIVHRYEGLERKDIMTVRMAIDYMNEALVAYPNAVPTYFETSNCQLLEPVMREGQVVALTVKEHGYRRDY